MLDKEMVEIALRSGIREIPGLAEVEWGLSPLPSSPSSVKCTTFKKNRTFSVVGGPSFSSL